MCCCWPKWGGPGTRHARLPFRTTKEPFGSACIQSRHLTGAMEFTDVFSGHGSRQFWEQGWVIYSQILQGVHESLIPTLGKCQNPTSRSNQMASYPPHHDTKRLTKAMLSLRLGRAICGVTPGDRGGQGEQNIGIPGAVQPSDSSIAGRAIIPPSVDCQREKGDIHGLMVVPMRSIIHKEHLRGEHPMAHAHILI